MLKKCYTHTNNSNLNSSQFYAYLKSINNPDSAFFQADEDVLIFNERYLNGELQVMFDELNIEISCSEILKACKQLRTGKSGGPDFLLNEFYKYGSDKLLP